MEEVKDKVGRGAEEAALIIDEYKQKLLRFIEEEWKQTREEANEPTRTGLNGEMLGGMTAWKQ